MQGGAASFGTIPSFLGDSPKNQVARKKASSGAASRQGSAWRHEQPLIFTASRWAAIGKILRRKGMGKRKPLSYNNFTHQ